MDDFFLASDALGVMVQYVGDFVGVGLGTAFMFWVLGYALWFVADVMRGG